MMSGVNNIIEETERTMGNNNRKDQVCTLGIDMSKKSFQLLGVNTKGRQALSAKLSRKKLLPFMANLPTCMTGIEVCSGASDWCLCLLR
jgi:transposase